MYKLFGFGPQIGVLLALTSSAHATDVLFAGIDYPTLQDTVDAASEGDTIILDDLCCTGHGAIIDGKGLTLIGRPGSRPVLEYLTLRNLPAQSRLVVHGVSGSTDSSPTPWFSAERCDGLILIDDVNAGGSDGVIVSATDCENVVLRRCELTGAYNINTWVAAPVVATIRSHVLAYECTLVGAPGVEGQSGIACSDGAPGGNAVELRDSSTLRVASSDVRGGVGGLGGWSSGGGCDDGPPGSAAEVDATSSLCLVATTTLGNLIGPGAILSLAGPQRRLVMPSHARSREALPVVVHGEPGDTVVLLIGSGAAFRSLPTEVGPLLVDTATLGRRMLGTIGGSGELTTSILTPAAPSPGIESFFAQPVFVDTQGSVRLGGLLYIPLVGDGGRIVTGGETIHVDPAAAPGGDGRDWTSAIDRLDLSLRRIWTRADLPQTDVWVAAGTYAPASWDDWFRVQPGVHVLGGFVPGMQSEGDRRPEQHLTILSGDILGNDGIPQSTLLDNSPTLLHVDGSLTEEGAALGHVVTPFRSVVSGFTIRSIDTRNSTLGYFGGIALSNGATLERCVLIANNGRDSAPAIKVRMGFLVAGDTTPRLDRVRAFGNRGPLVTYRSLHPANVFEIEGVLFHNNIATGASLIDVESGSLRLANSTIAFNTVGTGESAVELRGANDLVQNSILFGNRDASHVTQSVQIHVTQNAASVRVDRCLVSGWVGVSLIGEGTTGDDPLFIDPSGPDLAAGTADDNLRLPSGSPGVDSGNNALVRPEQTLDLDGNPRIADDPFTPDTGLGTPPIVDRGAYERQP